MKNQQHSVDYFHWKIVLNMLRMYAKLSLHVLIILFIMIQSAHIMGKVTKVLQMYLSTFLRLPWSPGIEITSAPAKSNPSKHEQSPYLSTTHFCSDLVVLCVLIYRTRWYTWKKVEIKPEGGKGSLAWPVWMEQGGWTVFNFPWLSRHES